MSFGTQIEKGAPTVQVTGLQVVAVFVTDLERARCFYVEHLGFVPDGEMPPGILLKAGDLTLYLEPGRSPRTRDAEPLTEPEISVCFAAGSVCQAHEALQGAGVPVVCPLQQFGEGSAFFRVADPDGNVIEFAGQP